LRETEEIKKVVIAGAGTIGATVARIFARHEYDVALYDNSKKSIEQAQEQLGGNSRFSFTQDKAVFEDADFVLECIFEDMGVKKSFWEDISVIVPEDIVLATNTSGLSVSEMAKAVHRPRRFAGMHWLNPAYILPLVEIVMGSETDREAADVIFDLSLSMHRKPVRVMDAPGFVFNRLQFAVLREAMHIVESGIADMKDVDDVVKYGLGVRYSAVGPFETADLGGLDTFYKIAEYLFEDLSDTKTVPEKLAGLYKNGDFGVKTGKGFYEYPGDSASKKILMRDELMTRLGKELFAERA
jgi:3-hydroxybutyryl-CoA dehydrogenase